MKCPVCSTEIGHMKFPPGSVVQVKMFDRSWHKGEVIGPARGLPRYTTVKVYGVHGTDSSNWCVPTQHLLPATPYGFGISIRRAAKT